jgi:hypothetical protein
MHVRGIGRLLTAPPARELADRVFNQTAKTCSGLRLS